MRHVDIGILWIQQRKEDDGINFRKVGGTANPADGLTKYLPPKDVNKHLEMVLMCVHFTTGFLKLDPFRCLCWNNESISGSTNNANQTPTETQVRHDKKSKTD